MTFTIGIVMCLSLISLNNDVLGFLLRPLVETKAGLVRGLRGDRGDYFMFLGIPYGKVYEKDPFAVAQPYPVFNPIFEAYNDSVSCLQPSIKEKDTIVGYGMVDCLRLNIYVPFSIVTKKSLPVMVWFHGGSFQYGSNSRQFYGPQYLVRHDVITVTVNYRLGAFGFLCLNTPEVPGNQGLKDQTLALRWIRKNIKSFGGDEKSVTFMGESAGSKSCDLHVHSNHELLFHQGIMQGGSTNTILPDLRRDDSEALLKLAKKLQLKTNNTNEALTYLKTLNPKSIAAATYQTFEFGPCVEQTFEGVESFLTENPINIDITEAQKLSLLIGVNSADQFSDYLSTDPATYESWDGFKKRLQSRFKFDEKTSATLEKIVRNFYIGEEKISHNVRYKLGLFDTDFGMLHPTKRTIQKYLNNGVKKVYLYVFSYVGGRNFMRGAINDSAIGALHADELGYLFDIPYFQRGYMKIPPQDQCMIDIMTKLWTNFAKYRDPTPQTSDILPVKWLSVTNQMEFHLNIDRNLTLRQGFFNERMAFWDLFYTFNEKHQRGFKKVDNSFIQCPVL